MKKLLKLTGIGIALTAIGVAIRAKREKRFTLKQLKFIEPKRYDLHRQIPLNVHAIDQLIRSRSLSQ